jgi:ABC-type nickel/cobalt efflux system permease component RcnA
VGDNYVPPSRRVTLVILVLVSQLLLMALAIAWTVHMVLIAKHGKVYFTEANPVILYGEITATIIITLFAATVFILQVIRLGERRKSDDAKRGDKK